MSVTELHNYAKASPYLNGMRPKQSATRATLSRNLRLLMERRDWTQKALEAKSGVSQRHISSLLNQQQDCTTEILGGLAHAFGLPGWLLLIPDLSAELLDSHRIPLLVNRYVDAGPEGRDLLDRLSEREASHNSSRTKIVPLPKSKAG